MTESDKFEVLEKIGKSFIMSDSHAQREKLESLKTLTPIVHYCRPWLLWNNSTSEEEGRWPGHVQKGDQLPQDVAKGA